MGFKESLHQGCLGELIVRDFFEKQSWCRGVIDLRYDKTFQEKDIDFMVENQTRQFNYVEVKTDFKAHETGNLAYEITTSGHAGCFDKTEANMIAYYLPESKELYLIDARGLRNYVYRKQGEPRPMGDNAMGFLIPFKELERNNLIRAHYKGVE